MVDPCCNKLEWLCMVASSHECNFFSSECFFRCLRQCRRLKIAIRMCVSVWWRAICAYHFDRTSFRLRRPTMILLKISSNLNSVDKQKQEAKKQPCEQINVQRMSVDRDLRYALDVARTSSTFFFYTPILSLRAFLCILTYSYEVRSGDRGLISKRIDKCV